MLDRPYVFEADFFGSHDLLCCLPIRLLFRQKPVEWLGAAYFVEKTQLHGGEGTVRARNSAMRARACLTIGMAPATIVMGLAGCGSGKSAVTASDVGSLDAGGTCPAAPAASAGTGDAGGSCLCPSASNLLPEPGFDTDVVAWAQNGGAAFNSLDATSCPRSGSLEVQVDQFGGTQTVTQAQCVPVTAGLKYDFGARVLVPAVFRSPSASIGLEWIEFTDCHGNTTMAAGPMSYPDRAGSWQTLSGSAIAPATATAAYLTLQVTTAKGMSSSSLFDDVYLAASPGMF